MTIAILSLLVLFVVVLVVIGNADHTHHYEGLLVTVVVVCVPLSLISCFGVCYLQGYRDEGLLDEMGAAVMSTGKAAAAKTAGIKQMLRNQNDIEEMAQKNYEV